MPKMEGSSQLLDNIKLGNTAISQNNGYTTCKITMRIISFLITHTTATSNGYNTTLAAIPGHQYT